MKRVLFTLCMVLSTLLIMAGERFTIGKYTFEITSPTEIELIKADESVSSVNLSPTITYQGTTYRVTSIGWSAFYDCSSLTSVTIGNSVTSIGGSAFDSCSSLISVTIPNSVINIGEFAFNGCSSLTSVAIPNSVTFIGEGAFDGCSSLKSITIPNSVTSIGRSAFYGTGIYTNAANWKNGALYINNCLIGVEEDFMGDYTIKAGTRLIAGGAFFKCSSLTSVTIPNSVTSIGNLAFSGCSSLKSIPIPNSVKSIGWDAFDRTGIYNNAANWKNGALYINNCLIKVEEDFMGDYTIKAGTRLIADGAFRGCSSLTSITIPNSVTSIGFEAFLGCSSLTSVKYTGTKEQWKKIVMYGWVSGSKIQVVRCTDGEIRL